ncbi:hypothetical protein P3L10_027486 [Capsicum annuum]
MDEGDTASGNRNSNIRTSSGTSNQERRKFLDSYKCTFIFHLVYLSPFGYKCKSSNLSDQRSKSKETKNEFLDIIRDIWRSVHQQCTWTYRASFTDIVPRIGLELHS